MALVSIILVVLGVFAVSIGFTVQLLETTIFRNRKTNS